MGQGMIKDESDLSSIKLPSVSNFRLDGLRALVTGASRGLGLGASLALAHAGARVCMLARNRQNLEEAARMLEGKGYKVEILVADVQDKKKIDELLLAEEPFDILVNNAGTNQPQAFLEVEEKVYDQIINLNLRATFFLSQTIARRMQAEGRHGSIINITSQMGRVGGEQRTAYCASKHGLEGLTKAMALDLAIYGIRVNAIAPTFIETDLTKSSLTEGSRRAAIIARIPLGRLGKVEDITGAVVFLASSASALITGESVAVDGGWTAV